ncbi:Protein kinase superfamily protein [Perilla frutescens var. hirtella]|uniref:Protein kinase superfamily protein n=1 Tax=Perilla frutescens var. hirtella TaxID=608512 RepID=A0AAD4P044_PERFH|nr:Protein kinase superfamily protein [Perilla frutescens var. hirtella]
MEENEQVAILMRGLRGQNLNDTQFADDNVKLHLVERIQDVSQEIKRVRAQMEENEQVAILMRGLRGQNLNDTQFADDNVKLHLVELTMLGGAR